MFNSQHFGFFIPANLIMAEIEFNVSKKKNKKIYEIGKFDLKNTFYFLLCKTVHENFL